MSTRLPVLLAGTSNPHKIAEIAAILRGLPLEVRGASSLPQRVEVDEVGETFEENARIKALAFARAAAALPVGGRPRWVLSDDSGLAVDALGGGPGVRSARYAGGPRSVSSPPASREGESEGTPAPLPSSRDEANNRKLLEALRGVPAAERGAAFVCSVALAEVTGGTGEPRIVLEARGECRGRIAECPRGTGGFGYDPLFLIPELGRTYAELDEAKKNAISHRGRALRALAPELKARAAAPLARAPGRV